MTRYQLSQDPDGGSRTHNKTLLQRALRPKRLAQAFVLAVLVDGGFNDGDLGKNALTTFEATQTAGQVYGAWGHQLTNFTKFIGLHGLVTAPFRKEYL